MKLFFYFFIVNRQDCQLSTGKIVNRQASSNRQAIVNRQSSIVNRQARGPGSLMSKKVDSVQKSGQSDLKRGHVQNIGR
jgi:hypothetical protein